MIPGLRSPEGSSSSSEAARIIPSETTPRSFACFSFVPSGITAPGRATATVWPASTFGAPHTIVASCSSPRSTVQTFRRSASGCFSALITLPTTKFSADGAPRRWIASTFVPVIVRRSSICATSSGGSQYSRSHGRGTLIARPFRRGACAVPATGTGAGRFPICIWRWER